MYIFNFLIISSERKVYFVSQLIKITNQKIKEAVP